jgi:hypothetical protein
MKFYQFPIQINCSTVGSFTGNKNIQQIVVARKIYNKLLEQY